MDYPFFSADLGKVPDDLMARLRECLASDQRTVKHDGFGYHQKIELGVADIPLSLVEDITDAVGTMRKEQYVGYKINVLRPHDKVHAHSDLSGRLGNLYNCAHRHNVHVVVETNPLVTMHHKRGVYSPDTLSSSRHFELGRMYAFNDYVQHWVNNPGDTSRVHVLFYYEDPKWEVKVDMFNKYKLTLDRYYELPADLASV